MILERAVGDALADERCYGDQTAVAQRKQVVAAPHLAKEYVVVEVCKFGCELAQLGASGCLYNLFCAMMCVVVIAMMMSNPVF